MISPLSQGDIQIQVYLTLPSVCTVCTTNRSTSSTSASLSPVSPADIFALPAEVFSLCLTMVSTVMVGGLFLCPALPYGTGYLTFSEIWPSAETPSSIHWRRFYFQLTRVHSALELFGWCALQIYLLTYLLTWPQSKATNTFLWQNTQDAQLSQRDRAAGCVTVFAKSRRLELGDDILRTL